MDRAAYEAYIQTQYGVLPDHPFSDDDDTVVYRHPGNRKWFALIMRIRKDRLMPGEQGEADVVNLKIEPLLGYAIRREPGIFPAYHMNKERWISAVLEDTTSEEQLLMLTDMSFSLTEPKIKPRKERRDDNAPV